MLTKDKINKAIEFCRSEIEDYRISERLVGLNDVQRKCLDNFLTALEALEQAKGE